MLFLNGLLPYQAVVKRDPPRSVSSFVSAAYCKVYLIPQDWPRRRRGFHLILLHRPARNRMYQRAAIYKKVSFPASSRTRTSSRQAPSTCRSPDGKRLSVHIRPAHGDMGIPFRLVLSGSADYLLQNSPAYFRENKKSALDFHTPSKKKAKSGAVLISRILTLSKPNVKLRSWFFRDIWRSLF